MSISVGIESVGRIYRRCVELYVDSNGSMWFDHEGGGSVEGMGLIELRSEGGCVGLRGKIWLNVHVGKCMYGVLSRGSQLREMCESRVWKAWGGSGV